MRIPLLLFCMAFGGFSLFAQVPVPNGDFETWNSTTLENPQHYPNTANADAFYRYGLPFNVVRSDDAYHGDFAVQLTTVASETDTIFGYLVNARPEGNPDSWTGGMAFGQVPTGIRGWYKYSMEEPDSATIIVAFSKEGNNIGTYYFHLGGLKMDYTLFEFSIDPPLADTPDSIALGVTSCAFNPGDEQPHGPAGSTLLLDSLSFTGVTSQPDMMNGDFESWERLEINYPVDWYVQTDRGMGYARSEDAYEGNFALELTTYEGNMNNHPAARPANASTGYYPDDCGGDCMIRGGNPFGNQVDTLVLAYKYAPAAEGDAAWVNIYLKKSGDVFWAGGIYLPASDEYTRIEAAIAAPDVPDSVIIELQSGLWEDSTLNYVGSKLVVDDIHFKSEEVIPTGLPDNSAKDAWSVYPNPTGGWIYFKGLDNHTGTIGITDMSGRLVYSWHSGSMPVPDRVDLSPFGKGMYFISIDGRSIKAVVK